MLPIVIPADDGPREAASPGDGEGVCEALGGPGHRDAQRHGGRRAADRAADGRGSRLGAADHEVVEVEADLK